MRTVIIGGGRGCKAIVDLASGAFLKELTLDIECVVDRIWDAPGMLRARELGINTSLDMYEALHLPDIGLVIELTGQDSVLESIYKALPKGARLVDHTFAHIFWDLVFAQREQERQLQEITELEQKVEKEWHFLQSLFDTIQELVVVLDRNKRAMKINAGFSRLSARSPDDVVGKSCRELLENSEVAVYCQEMDMILDDVLSTGQQRTCIWQTSTPVEAHWEVTYTPILSQKGEPEAVVATWHRITEKVMLHRKMERAEHWLKSFINSAQDWITIKGLDGRYLEVNPTCAHAFRLKPEDCIGKRPDEVFPIDIADTIEQHDQEVIQSNQHRTYDEVIRINGRDHHLQTVRFPMSDHAGEAAGVCTIARDVSSERELHDQLTHAAKLAAVGRLAAGVAHEINNPLTGILAYAEDMRDQLPVHDRFQGDLGVIIRETLRCREIVRNLLDFARPGRLRLEQMDMNVVVDRALSLVHKLPRFRNISIRKELADRLPPIQCDAGQLQQVLLNLMLNATEAMNEVGEIVIATSCETGRDRCIVSVSDNGPGVASDLRDKVFEPFFSTKGTNGLGLAVTWGIVERHRGTIEVGTADTGGAVFRVEIPVVGVHDPMAK